MLDRSVFAGVIRDYCEHSAVVQAIPHIGERSLKRLHLIVHRDAKRLEDPREFTRARSRAKHRAYGANEIVTSPELTILTPSNHLARHFAGTWLVTVFTKYSRDLVFRRGIQKICSVFVIRGVHSHVERRTFPKRKTAGWIIELVRRNAEIGENRVELLLRIGEQPFCLGEVAQYNAEPACRLIGSKPVASGLHRFGVSVDRSD
jgi:hypothetical protein